jgi:CTP synthase
VDNSLDKLIVDKLGLRSGSLELDDWRELLHRLRNPRHEISVAVVGKYAEHRDAYKSVYEAIDHAGMHHGAQIRIGRVQSEEVQREGPERLLSGYDGVLVPGGFGVRGLEGMVEATRFAREKRVPFFGICLGMQSAVIEFGRNVVNLESANSTEFDKDTMHPVICLLDEQQNVTDKGGTMRLGAQPTKLAPGCHAEAAYGSSDISERHRHRYEFNNSYRQRYDRHGMSVTGSSPDDSFVEIVEILDHPWFLAVQFHPEFKSQPTKSHPLFAAFIEAAIEQKKKRSNESSSTSEAEQAHS